MGKKIIYLFHYNEATPGVVNKLQDKVLYLSQMGIDIQCVATYYDNKPILEDKYAHLFVFKKETKLDKKISIFENRFFAWINIWKSNKVNARKMVDVCNEYPADLYIRRMGWANRSQYKFVKKIKGNIVWESNTLLESEIKVVLGGYVSFFKSEIWKTYLIYQNKKYSKKIASISKRIICVTQQINDYHQSKSNCKTVVIANGIDVNKYPVCSSNETSKDINFVFLLGTNAPWHGTDLLIKAIELSVSENFKVHIIGDVVFDFSSSKIVVKKKMNFEELNTYFKSLSNVVGIGSLAMDRNNLTEGSTLKIREYCARGMPTVLNHFDTDLSKDKDFMIKYGIDILNKKLDFDEIILRSKQIFQNLNYSQEIRKWAMDNLDQNIKMKQYKKALDKVFEA